MARLSLRLLGGCQFERDGVAIHPLATRARALLAYLAVEQVRSHLRTHLAALLWPDRLESIALTYLRQTLSHLITVVALPAGAPPLLCVSRESLQFNRECECSVDAVTLSAAAHEAMSLDTLPERGAAPLAEHMAEAAALYRGPFLQGLALDGCPDFEQWQRILEERLRREAALLYSVLSAWHDHRSSDRLALEYAWRGVEVEPLLTEPRLYLTRMLIRRGESRLAIAHHDAYVRQLREEYDLSPAPDLEEMVAQLRAGVPIEMPSPRPALLPNAGAAFVDREAELGSLIDPLKQVLAGRGQCAFVIGEAGSGKSALLQEFVRRVRLDQGHWLVAGASCSEINQGSDTFQPFRDLLVALAGEGEADGGCAPTLVLETLLENCPDLIGPVLPHEVALRLAGRLPPASQPRRISEYLAQPEPAPTRTPAICDQLMRFLRALAAERPLILWLDDLQWAGAASVGLFFYLCRRLENRALLVVGIFRPEETPAPPDWECHPLELVVEELCSRHGAQLIDLGTACGERFAAAYFAAQPGRPGPAIERRLLALTGGLPLWLDMWTRHLREGGGNRDWGTIPPGVELLIERRLAALPAALRALLEVAAVEGEEFTAEVAATVLGRPCSEVVHALSADLERRQRLVVAVGVQMQNGHVRSCYHFRQEAVREYLRSHLDAVEAAYLRAAIDRAQAGAYPDCSAYGIGS